VASLFLIKGLLGCLSDENRMKQLLLVVIAACLVASWAVVAQNPPPSPTNGITLAQARAAVNAVLAHAVVAHPNVGFAVVVMDTGGNVKASVRMDNAALIAADLAELKAKSSIYFLLNTTFFQEVGLTLPTSGFFGFETTYVLLHTRFCCISANSRLILGKFIVPVVCRPFPVA
jgi:hypothetical protein